MRPEGAPTGDLTLGRTVHQTLHDNYQQKIESHHDLSISDVTDIFSGYWEQQVPETQFGKDEKPEKLKDQGVGLIRL